MRIRSLVVLPALISLVALLSVSIDGSAPAYGQNDMFQATKQITSGPGNHLRPDWSPDGRYLVFQANPSGETYTIWIVARDGTGLRQVTEGKFDDRRPTWSPDGSRIAFDSMRSGNRDIWTIAIDGSDLRRVTEDPGEETFPSWSPDGKQLAYYYYADESMSIWLSDLQGGKPRRLANAISTVEQKGCTFACHAVSWNKDGTQIAYSGGDQRSVWVMNADGSQPKSQTSAQRLGAYRFPDWTEDGSLIFISEEIGEKPYTDVWMLKPGVRNIERLYTRIDHGGPFEWSPDGQRVAFHSPRTGQFNIFVAELPGSNIGKLATYRDKLSVNVEATTSKSQVNTYAGAAAIGAVLLVALIGTGAIVFRLRGRAKKA